MKKRLTTIILTLAVAITGIFVMADKTKAEIVTATEAPGENPEVTPTTTPAVTTAPTSTPGQPQIADSTPIPTETPEPVEKVKEILVERDMNEICHNPEGKTFEITKGFETKIGIYVPRGTEVNWTSSNPDVISITNEKNDEGPWLGSFITVKANKYGKSTLTAKYGEHTTNIVLKSAKNNGDYHESYAVGVRKSGKFSYVFNLKASVKYDKKGNLVVKCGERATKWTKIGKKENSKSYFYTGFITIKIQDKFEGENVVKYYKKNIRLKRLSAKSPKYTTKVVIPKKYVKKKNVDLRKCHYEISVF